MAAPAYVNQGGIDGNTGVTLSSSGLPGSIVANNLLLCWCQINLSDNVVITGFTAPNWKFIGGRRQAGQSIGLAAKIAGAGGSDVPCGFSWGSPATYHTRTLQFSGNIANNQAIGRMIHQAGNSNSISVGGLQVSTASALVLAMLFAVGDNAIPVPGSYAGAAGATFHDGGGSDMEATQAGPAQYGVSNAAVAAISAGIWDGFLLEIRSLPAPNNGAALYSAAALLGT